MTMHRVSCRDCQGKREVLNTYILVAWDALQLPLQFQAQLALFAQILIGRVLVTWKS